MSDEAKFRAFKQGIVDENEAAYGREAREKYGDSQVDAANENLMGLTREQYREWQQLGEEIQSKLEQALTDGLSPASETGRELTDLHRRWLTVTIRDYSPEKHRGIAQLYVLDERFTAYYDKNKPGCARFLTDALTIWAK